MPYYFFQAKYGLLTYAQSDGLDPFRIVDVLSALGAECIVGREAHADGGIHYHAFFMFDRKYRTRNARAFDVDGYHPNVLTGRRTPAAMYDYATKDGDICAGGIERGELEQPATESKDEKYRYIIDANTREEVLERAAEVDPAFFLRSYLALRAYAETKDFKNPLDYVSSASNTFSTENYPEIDDWVASHLGRRGNRLVIPLLVLRPTLRSGAPGIELS